MVRILPAVIHPFQQVITRGHKPPEAKYTTYRACLRWEFGFSCAFCLLHEADIAASGVEGWGVMQIEHFVPKSHDRNRVKDYTNCFYICRLCNLERRAAENQASDGPNLLNPCADAWGQYFRAVADKILPIKNEDENATYTCQTYNFNDPRKVRSRSRRRRLIRQCSKFIEEAHLAHESILDQAETEADPGTVVLAKKLYAMQRLAKKDLLQFQAVPADADAHCRCEASGHLPPGLAGQLTPMPS